jgi:hypothetical protein
MWLHVGMQKEVEVVKVKVALQVNDGVNLVMKS